MAKISVGDHVHYAPQNLEAEEASLTPVYTVVFTNTDYTGVIRAGTNVLTEVLCYKTTDFVPSKSTDPTEPPTSE